MFSLHLENKGTPEKIDAHLHDCDSLTKHWLFCVLVNYWAVWIEFLNAVRKNNISMADIS